MEKTIEWIKTGKNSGFSRMIDQIIIPYEYKKVDIKTSDEMYNAIKTMIVRGAPAIGIAGAHGVCLAAIENKDSKNFIDEVKKVAQYINSSRPTAVNLIWAIKKQLEISFEGDTPLKKREDKNFGKYFELIWRNLS